ncbi:hypothetical protein [Paenibacillus sp. IHBB 10380]|uniref:hypothetical protein n=1 Tax=Paenibacillus sp. IHBB 10380 TaxID=1566358 RepID=UPI0005CF96CB|nr:hypothetical protein [Paenibacillus sp. IHBB 10380]AJS57378.1 hypothetical protein UB51_01465 [Paenibacillus sp. IHBB 10380]
MGSYTIHVDHINKVINCKVAGSFSAEDGTASIEAYQRTISSFTVSEYDIDIDCTKLRVTKPSLLPMLEGFFLMYKADGFKRIIFRVSNNRIVKMQLNRIALKAELTNLEIIEEELK